MPAKKAEWKKQTRNWVENSARVYHLVLLHCPPGLIAELQNHSKWIAGKAAQDCIALLLMIRDLTHGMKESKQGTMALVQVHVDLFTTTQRPNESVEAYYKLFCARRDTVNAHGGEAGFHKELYAKARMKIMTAKGRNEASTRWKELAHLMTTLWEVMTGEKLSGAPAGGMRRLVDLS